MFCTLIDKMFPISGSNENLFEDKLVEETKRYYSIESVKLLRQYPVIEYMKLVEQRLAEEKKRLYLEETTLDRLSRACEEVLIEKHLVIFKNEFKELLSEEKRDDLGRMFRLVKKLPDGLKELCSWIESWIGAVKSSTIKRAGYAGHNVPEVLTLLATGVPEISAKRLRPYSRSGTANPG